MTYSSTSNDFVLSLTNLSHRYGRTIVLANANISLSGGQIIGVFGPNGAGKSTLLKIISGLLKPSGGAVSINGKTIPFGSPAKARLMGVRYISQELSSIDSWSISQQLEYEARGCRLPKFEKLLTKLGFTSNKSEKIGKLSSEQKQILEIVKALISDVQLLLFDEPTSGLDTHQRDALYDELRVLAKRGKLVLVVSHDLFRLESVCDRFLLVEKGEVTEKTQIVEYGQEASSLHSPQEGSLIDASKTIGVKLPNQELLSFNLGQVTGVTGSLKHEVDTILRRLFGIRPDGLKVSLDNKTFTPSLVSSKKLGVRYVSQDRKREWGFPDKPMWENIDIRLSSGRSKVFRNRKVEREFSEDIMRAADIRPYMPEQNFNTFSGGNRQKAIVASELARSPKILLLDEPLSGVDSVARAWLTAELRNYVSSGGTAILYSQERSDLVSMCNKVINVDKYFLDLKPSKVVDELV